MSCIKTMIPRNLLVNANRCFHGTAALGLKKERVIATVNAHEFHKIIKHNRPDTFKAWDPRRSCDLEPLGKIDPNWLTLDYRPFADILDKLPEEQRRVFTVGFGPRNNGTWVLLENALAQTRRHKYDTWSLDFKVTWATWKIRNVQDMLLTVENAYRNGIRRNDVKELIEKRKKWLNRMRHQDYKRFEWIIEVLGVVYKLRPPHTRIERKASLNVLVNMFCNELRDKKMVEYQQLLEDQKVPFLKEKLETLYAIRADEDSVNIPSSVEEDIRDTKKRLEGLEKSHMTIHPVGVSDVEKQSNAATNKLLR